MTMIGEARAALQRADAELSDVDARINRSPGLRNAGVYIAYAVLFALVQIPMIASLAVRDASPVAGVPCGLVLVAVSFWLAWLTIGFAYREPNGQRPRRTPALGIMISLLAAAPAFVTTAWAAFDVIEQAERSTYPRMMRLIASARDFASSRSMPRTADVTVRAPPFWTPRMAMHMCSHSSTTIDTTRIEPFHEQIGDLSRQPLLHLRPAGEGLDQPGQLRQPGDPPVRSRHVADVRHPVEGQQMVLAQAGDLDVPHQHQFVVVGLERGREHLRAGRPAGRRRVRRRRGRPGPASPSDRRGPGPRRPRGGSPGRPPRCEAGRRPSRPAPPPCLPLRMRAAR